MRNILLFIHLSLISECVDKRISNSLCKSCDILTLNTHHLQDNHDRLWKYFSHTKFEGMTKQNFRRNIA